MGKVGLESMLNAAISLEWVIMHSQFAKPERNWLSWHSARFMTKTKHKLQPEAGQTAHSKLPLLTKYIFSPSSPGWKTTSSPCAKNTGQRKKTSESIPTIVKFAQKQVKECKVYELSKRLAKSIAWRTVSQSFTRIGLISCLRTNSHSKVARHKRSMWHHIVRQRCSRWAKNGWSSTCFLLSSYANKFFKGSYPAQAQFISTAGSSPRSYNWLGSKDGSFVRLSAGLRAVSKLWWNLELIAESKLRSAGSILCSVDKMYLNLQVPLRSLAWIHITLLVRSLVLQESDNSCRCRLTWDQR